MGSETARTIEGHLNIDGYLHDLKQSLKMGNLNPIDPFALLSQEHLTNVDSGFEDIGAQGQRPACTIGSRNQATAGILLSEEQLTNADTGF